MLSYLFLVPKKQINPSNVGKTTMNHLPNHNFYRWYVYHSQSWVVYDVVLPTWFHHETPETGALLPVRSTCRIIAWYLWRSCEPSSFSRRRNAANFWRQRLIDIVFTLDLFHKHGMDSSTIGPFLKQSMWSRLFGWNPSALSSHCAIGPPSEWEPIAKPRQTAGLAFEATQGPKNSYGELMVSRFEWSLKNLTWNRTNRTFRWNQETTQSCIIWSNVHDFLCVFFWLATHPNHDLEHSHAGWLPLFGLWIELGYPSQEVSPKEESSLALFGTYSIELG